MRIALILCRGQFLKAIQRGIIVHALLEILPQYPADQRQIVAQKLLADQAYPLSQKEQKSLTECVIKILSDPKISVLFSPSSLAEVPVSGVVGNRVINGKIDRLNVLNDEVLLIDYKSGSAVPENINDTPVAYVRQMAAYKALIEKIYPDKKVRCFLLWTEEAQVDEISSLVCDIMEY